LIRGRACGLAASRRQLAVLIDVDVGQRRTGVTTPALAIELAHRIARSPALQLAGIQGYAGNLQHVVSFEERAGKCREVHERVRAMRDHLEQNGFRCEVISGGGTGTAVNDAASGVLRTQPVRISTWTQYETVQITGRPSAVSYCASVFTRVIDAPHPGSATTDGGTKPWRATTRQVVAGAPAGFHRYAGDSSPFEYADTVYRARSAPSSATCLTATRASAA
jgi:D-serine deaminase-like pyridoxal phosphate-dependent protein